MLNHPADLWNQIASEQTLLTPWAETTFPLSQDALQASLQDEAANLRKDRTPGTVILAFQTVRPLLLEQEALEAFLLEHPEYQGFLTPVATVDEALLLAEKEFWLDETELKALRALLEEIVNEQMPA